jgi:hypothetical protein
MYGYPWDYFPARLHSTREIIFFLENINNIRQILDTYPHELTNLIFGDIHHPTVKEKALKFMNTNKKYKNKLILEISSRKVMYYNNIPLNYYYSNNSEINKRYTITERVLTDAEIDYDLGYITRICKEIFNDTIEVHVIPHLNLKTKNSNDYIPDRNNFVKLLEQLSFKYNIHIHNIGKYIESMNTACPFLEVYMYDSTHYSKEHKNMVKSFLIRDIIGV